MASALAELLGKVVSILTNDGRNIVGTLRGYDQMVNLILEESHERIYSTEEGVQTDVLGLFVIKGDNVSIVGAVDEAKDAALDLDSLRGEPLQAIKHG